jgi:hypothetical protein
MKPSNFTTHPWSSVTGNSEHETIAQNIMIILKRTGDEFRELTWEEYREERLKDGNFYDSEKKYFDAVIDYCDSAKSASLFCNGWKRIYSELKSENEQ